MGRNGRMWSEKHLGIQKSKLKSVIRCPSYRANYNLQNSYHFLISRVLDSLNLSHGDCSNDACESNAKLNLVDKWRRCELEAAGSGHGYKADWKYSGTLPVLDLRFGVDSARNARHSAQ